MIEIYAVGGYNEVGKNCTAVNVDGEVIVIDLGINLENYIKLTEDEDIVKISPDKLMNVGAVPDISVLDKIKNNVKAIIGKDKLHIGEEDKTICCLTKKQSNSLNKFDGKVVIFGIRPEDIEISRTEKDQCSIKAEVYLSQSMGVEDILNLNITKGLLIRAISPPKILVKTGESVYANINMERAHLFDKDSKKRIV